MSERPPAIVVGLDNVTGLQTSRTLARNGIEVVGVAADTDHPATRTRYVDRVVAAPAGGDGLIEALERLEPSVRGGVLFPCTDAAVLTISAGRDRLAGLRSVLPAHEVVETLLLKERFAEHVAAAGLPAPRGRDVRTYAEAVAAADELTFPCVVKPSVKSPAWETHGPKVRAYEAATDWLAEVEQLLDLSPTLVIQEHVPGGEDALFTCNLYVSPRGLPILSYVSQKLRQWPPVYGTGSLAVAVRDDAVRDLAVRTVASLPFHGLAYVEVKRDPRDGRDVLIEANVCRPTGRSAAADADGVQLLFTMYMDAIGEPPPLAARQSEAPLKWVHVTRDLRAAWRQLRRGELTPSAWLRSLRGPRVYGDLDIGDLQPFLGTVRRGAERTLAARRGPILSQLRRWAKRPSVADRALAEGRR